MKRIIIPSLLFFLSINLNAQNIWRVNNNPAMIQDCEHCFEELQDAINSSSVLPGDTVHLEASVQSYEPVIVNKPLTIIGTGYLLNENQVQAFPVKSSVMSILIDAGAEGSRIVSITVEDDIDIDPDCTGNIEVDRCEIASQFQILLPSSFMSNVSLTKSRVGEVDFSGNGGNSNPVTNLTISNNVISNSINLRESFQGLLFNNVLLGSDLNLYSSIEAYNNIFASDDIIFDQEDNSPINIHHNIFADEIDWLDSENNYEGIVMTNYVFPASGNTEELFTPLPETTCTECYLGYDADDDTDDELMGVFGGDDPYRLSGIPAIPTIYQLGSTTVSYPGGNVNVQISTRSNN